MDFKDLIAGNEFVILDGAMGTMLQQNGMKAGELPELIGISRPEIVTGIHREYIEAGAQIIYANTFGANRYNMNRTEYSVEDAVKAAIQNAKKAAQGTDVLVALDIGPIGHMLEPLGSLRFEDAYELYKEEVLAGNDADVIVIETMTDLYDMKAALLAAKENSDLPVICSMTFERSLRTFTGCPISAMALTAQGLGADAIGLNCSLGPKEIVALAEEIAKWTSLPIVVKPNAGLPDPETGAYDVSPEEFAGYMKEMVGLGVKIFGGCCGTTPAFIKSLREMLSKEHFQKNVNTVPSGICSASKTVIMEGMLREEKGINPAGDKDLENALIEGDMDYVADLAMEMAEEEAEIISVNAAIAGVDEKECLPGMIRTIQSITNIPLVIDSVVPEAVEAAARVYNGVPGIYLGTGDDKSLQAILPIAKKYGALVIPRSLSNEQ
ncbi:homocysteine S-methyltransferase family protein [Parasporobacterium paucivorans]|uniref:Methionine synthase n=1 Tax=Parasporobacterium paucivorans DSM 15970 TaxID=1122934 RepID=A0A1M6AEA4_9FIRM|nr:homocysteine S-methyltransferase family protein [Parasporobacterium paucivorans]SHI34747.1 Methionine synthase I (cobalamin-dependent), methyltransferase domain [Parasporobacterium paucivorans DSM 15970]